MITNGILAVLLVASNVFWAWFLYKLICKHSHKEWELLERIRTPDSSIMPPVMVEEEAKKINQKPDEPTEQFEFLEADDEFNIVGQVFPNGAPGRDDN